MKRLLLILTALIILVSCQKKLPESEKAFRSYMDIITKNEDGQKNIMGNYNEVEFINRYFSKVSYKIISVEETEDKSLIKLEVTSPDIINKLLELQKNPALIKAKNNTNKEEVFKIMDKVLMPVLNDKKVKYIKKEKRIFMVKKDGNWVITNNLHGEDGYFNLLLKEAFVNLI